MKGSIMMKVYRVLASLVIVTPIAVNIQAQGDFVTSILYVPLASMFLLSIAIFVDGKLERPTQRQKNTETQGETGIQALIPVLLFKETKKIGKQQAIMKGTHHAA